MVRTARATADSAVGLLPWQSFLDAPNEVGSPDFGLFRDTLTEHFYPARIEALDRGAACDAPRISARHLASITIGYVAPGTTASVDCGDLSAYHVNVAVQGRVASRCGRQEAVASPTTATVFCPDRHTALPRWDADAAQLSIKLVRSRVEEELSGLLGRPVVKPIDFSLPFPIDEGPGRRWISVLAALLHTVDAPESEGHLRHLELLERSLISALLLSQQHSYSDQLVAEPRSAAPRHAVDRVVEEIEREPDRGYSLTDLARSAGMSARALQYAFQERFEISPMQFLRQVRLDRAHVDLVQGTGTVAEVAAYWGFTNPGRFARAYRDRFGESPVDTRHAHRH